MRVRTRWLFHLICCVHALACSSSDARAAPPAPAANASSSPAASASVTSPKTAATELAITHEAAVVAAPSNAETLTPEAVLQLPSNASTSIGGPSTGQVRGAVALPDKGRGFYHNPIRPYEARFGTVELVQTIMRAAAIVENELPGSVLVVNDLGLQAGGPIRQHASHQAGRDADILFFSVDSQGKPLPSVGVPIDPKGQGTDFKDLADPSDDQPVALDVPRTWRFAAALLEAAGDNLQRIFIVEHVRSMLLAEAARVHADPAIMQRFADVTCQPEAPHDDHMHVRLFCTPEDMALGCRDGTPTYPFRVAALSALGLTPVLQTLQQTIAARKARAQRTTTPEEARKKAGPMHALVKEFLHQREAWLKRPSPGRPYCR